MRFWLLPWSLGCAVEEPGPAVVPPAADDAGPTWVEVAPLLARCATCHSDAGLTFPITGYAEAAALAPIIASVVATRQMPPWRAGPASELAFRDDPSLTDTEIATIAAWAEAGAPLGDADPDVPLIGPAADHLPRVDATLTTGEPYVPTVSPDDHRCFVLDRADLGDTWVTGIEIQPGNLAAAHHFMVLALIPSDPDYNPVTADAADPGPGFDCTETTAGSFPGEYQQIGGWLPGRGAVMYPEGSGVFLDKDAILLLKAHYFTPSSNGEPDLTQVQLMLAPEVTVKAAELKVNNPDWSRQRSVAVPAGQTVTHDMISGVREEAAQMTDIDPTGGLRVHWVLLHMHELGVSARLEVLRGGERIVLLDIPRWDFDWQLEYWLQEPFVLKPDDELEITCVHDNPTAEDVWWGELTSEEMCIARIFVSEEIAVSD